MVNDVISDMLTRIRNASKVKHHLVQVPFTKMTLAIAQVLKEENFIEDFQEFSQSGRKFLLILLKYKGKLVLASKNIGGAVAACNHADSNVPVIRPGLVCPLAWRMMMSRSFCCKIVLHLPFHAKPE